jgi:5-methylcytosine-specific restriction endonuclease McrA
MDDKKRCSKCEEWKSFDCFGVDRTGAYGLRSQCKDCRCGIEKQRYASVKAILGMAVKTYKRLLMPGFYSGNENERRRERYREDAEYREKQRQHGRESHKNYRQSHKEKELERIRTKENNRRAVIQGSGKITNEQWQELRRKYNYTCLKCKRREPDIKLTLDHVKPLKLGGPNIISNAQPLCGSCNSGKGAREIDYR